MVLTFFGQIARAVARIGRADVAEIALAPVGGAVVSFFGKLAAELWEDYRRDERMDQLRAEIQEVV